MAEYDAEATKKASDFITAVGGQSVTIALGDVPGHKVGFVLVPELGGRVSVTLAEWNDIDNDDYEFTNKIKLNLPANVIEAVLEAIISVYELIYTDEPISEDE